MRKLLNTLYITKDKSYLTLDGENLVVLIEQESKFRIPFVNIENIVCFGYMGASPALMGKCANNNIGLYFLRPNGEFLAKITGKTKGSVFLRQTQYEKAKNREFCLDFSKNIIGAKLHNTKQMLDRSIRDDKGKCDLSKVKTLYQKIDGHIKDVFNSESIETIRGIEGTVAKQYFGIFNAMIVMQKEEFCIYGRSKRPPLDNVNCMLSYLYVILSLEIESALETVGLDPCVGFMHQLRAGRKSLAVDLAEELRAYMVDRLVISIINLKKISPNHFHKKEGGGILMTDDGRRILLTCWQERKKEIIKHTIINEKIEIGLIPYVQAQLLARVLREDTPEYHPFLYK